MSIKKLGFMLLSTISLAALLNGCGANSKESSGNPANVAKVDEATCAQCHGSAREKLTGRVIYDEYAQSVHLLKGVGCQDCHGGGAQHNGVGPIPYAKPNHEQCKTCHDSSQLVTNYASSKHLSVVIEEAALCNRCHTHQGAVLAAQTGLGFTGDKATLTAGEAAGIAPGALALADAEPIKCNTCHITHKPQDLRIDAAWQPKTAVGGAVVGNDQYRLCTQCHTYINNAGQLVATATGGTTTSAFEHDTSWYRVIATTHYDNPATTAIEGYGVRTTGANPCFDCHGHESKTNTSTLTRNAAGKYVTNTAVESTIYTDWAKSAHAGKILTAKYAAQEAYPKKSDGTYDRSLGMTNAVMAATSPDGQWTGNRNATATCVRCHTETGFVEYYGTSGDVTAATVAVAQTEVLTCRGCHTNAATGALRVIKGGKTAPNYTTDLGHNPTTTLLTTGYGLSYGKKAYPDVAGSNICITCHDGRSGDPAANTTTLYSTGAAVTTPQAPHDMPAAALVYVKMGFLNLSTGTAGTTTAYLNSLKSDQDGGTITSTHRKLGTPAIIGDTHTDKSGVATFATAASAGKLASNGPCVTCHLGGSHSLKIDQKAITAVCNRCHSSEAGNDITTLANFDKHFIEPQAEVYNNAIGLAFKAFNAKQTSITYALSTSGSWTAYSNTLTSGAGATLRPAYNATTYAAYLAGTGNQPASAVAADWTGSIASYGGNQTKLFGAISNLRLFMRDPAAYAHARTYSRRLLYDTIDYLDDATLNMSVGASAIALDPTKYGKGTSAYTDGKLTTLATGTSESMTFLIKWSRTDGSWSSPQRP